MDPLDQPERIDALVLVNAAEDSGLYEIQWDMWTRFPALKERVPALRLAISESVRRRLAAKEIRLVWCTWHPHTQGEEISASDLDEVLNDERWWSAGTDYVGVFLTDRGKEALMRTKSVGWGRGW